MKPWEKYKEGPWNKYKKPEAETVQIDEGPRFLFARMVNPKTGKPEVFENVTDEDFQEKLKNGWAEVSQVPNPNFKALRNKALSSNIANMATLGFADEIEGGIKYLFGDKSYTEERDQARSEREAASEKYPVSANVGKVIGGAIPAIASRGSSTLAASPALTATVMGGVQGLGESGADLTKGEFGGAAIDTGFGAGTAAALGALFKIAPALAKKLGLSAERMAEKATGATRVQAQKFRPGTGRELLDRKIVTFGDSPAGIAEKARGGLEKAGSQIDEAISGMDKSGQIIDKEAIIQKLEAKIKDLETDPSKSPIIAKLRGYIDDVRATPANVESVEGTVEGLTPGLAERTKRGYQSLANYTDPEKTQAVKQAADVFKEEVESAAAKAGPGIYDKFAQGKKDWGLLAPVEEAASNRATQLIQSPVGGFLDTTAAAVGAVSGGGMAAVPAAVARRTLAPRLASSMAVATDKASKVLGAKVPGAVQNVVSRFPETLDSEDQGIPIDQMGKFSGVLQKAKENGKLAITHYVLSQSNPEYQRMLNQGESDE